MSKKRECSICYDETFSENPIIKCGNCDVSAHVLCYGIQNKDDFKCSPCAKDIAPSSIPCALCNKTGGAMKITTDERWVHVICVFFEPNSAFMNNETMEPVDIEKVNVRKKFECIFCMEKFSTFKCAKKGCQNKLHASCGLENWTIEERIMDNGDLSFYGYCSADHFNDGSSKSKKRLSSDNVKLVLLSKTMKKKQAEASKENSNWILTRVMARRHTNAHENVLEISLTKSDGKNQLELNAFDIESAGFESNDDATIDDQSAISSHIVSSIDADVHNAVELVETNLGDETPSEEEHMCEKDIVINKVSKEDLIGFGSIFLQ